MLESNQIHQIELMVNRLRMEMVKRGDMMSVEDVCEILAVPLIALCRMMNILVVSTNQGEPLVGTDCPAGRAYANIARRVTGEHVELMDMEEKKGLFGRRRRRPRKK